MKPEHSERIQALRELMAQRGIDAYIVPSTDEHHSEYVPDCAKRIQWLTGFTGSAGTLVVTSQKACLWTDGRYHLQAREELDPELVILFPLGLSGVPELQDWLACEMGSGTKVGVDSKLISVEEAQRLRERLAKKGAELLCSGENLVDLIWEQRPRPPWGRIFALQNSFTGSSVQEKLARVRGEMARMGVQALLLSGLDEVAWLSNLRGSDVAYNPVFLGYVLVSMDKAALFLHPEKLASEAAQAVGAHMELRPYQELAQAVSQEAMRGSRFWLDPGRTSLWVRELVGNKASHLEARSPVCSLKAVKNQVEREGMKNCHLRDGLAMVRFLRWLEQEAPGSWPTEMEAARHLEELRAQLPYHHGPSFETIVAYGPHGAIVHYRPTPETDLRLGPQGLLLVDSGAHYLDGTTDVTRTVALGPPTEEQMDRYTRVLKGHVALARARFPRDTSGKQLDVLARLPLWDVGLDYRHGTGHGIGCFLNVHEGPQSISPRDPGVPLEPGMFVSNEPGYYREGAYGIRIESVMMVEEDPNAETDYGPFLRFEVVTLVPLDRRLISPRLLSPAEREWVNSYHARVLESLGPHLDGDDLKWLRRVTKPI
ncbi:MAG: aminopeptidase P family protein [Thermodesulfobacteriota bacterium]